MPITRDTVERLCRLARLDLPSVQLDKTSVELSHIVEYIDRLQAVQTEEIALATGDTISRGTLREDHVRPSLAMERALENAHQSKGGFFLVPRVI